jgi:chaperonin GroES
MNLKPVNDHIVVVVEKEKARASGIIVTSKEDGVSSMGKVLAIGPGKEMDDGKLKAMVAQVGQMVIFGKYSGTEVELEGEKFLVIRNDDVVGIVE